MADAKNEIHIDKMDRADKKGLLRICSSPLCSGEYLIQPLLN